MVQILNKNLNSETSNSTVESTPGFDPVERTIRPGVSYADVYRDGETAGPRQTAAAVLRAQAVVQNHPPFIVEFLSSRLRRTQVNIFLSFRGLY